MTTATSDERAERVPTRLGALHVRTIGSGPTTVLWPSMFVDSSTWNAILPLLGTARRFVLVDGPGLGLSEPLLRRSSIEEAADAATDLLAALDVSGPVDWVGNAFGGHVGYQLAARDGILRSLVSISAPAAPIGTALRARIRALLPVLRVAGPVGPVRDAVIGAMLTEASANDDAIRRVVVESLARPSRRSLTHALRSFILDRRDVTDDLAAIGVPCLYIASDDRGDWSTEEAIDAASRTPDAVAVTVPRARTLIPLEQPALVAEHITAFWAGLG
ncbi:alpha/beta hydrolase [Galbitalea sp. SE-J8]|uniref:alpha/beta fold hydrolase n=1 Tax=Galbitalea sp. SE-J8 TaxID=3054952 RepID=UPI00259CA34F|nr:alpha/beta hydrolase [Galbitalea sp. SE-J8]MDM4763003.1 alpha/beta hydrolase [Galbitalea sp. SE-J8]